MFYSLHVHKLSIPYVIVSGSYRSLLNSRDSKILLILTRISLRSARAPQLHEICSTIFFSVRSESYYKKCVRSCFNSLELVRPFVVKMIKLIIVIASLLWCGSSYSTVVKCPWLSRCGDQRIHVASWRGPSPKALPPYRVEIDKNNLSEFKGNLKLKHSCASYI